MRIEEKIDSYRNLYKLIKEFLIQSEYRIDWSILKKHQSFIENLDAKTLYDHEVETVQKELNNFIKTLTNFTWTDLVIINCAKFNYKINLKQEIEPKEPSSNNPLYQLVVAMSYGTALASVHSKKIKRNLKNTFETLITVKKCISDCGLLIEDIKRRPNYMLYNFVLVDKTEIKKETYSHYYITKKELNDYLNLRELGQPITIKGKYWAYSPNTHITITATKFKDEEEISFYKELKGIRSDLAFSKCVMCSDITSQLISSKVPDKLPQPVKSVHDLIRNNKIKDAIDLVSNNIKASQEDKDELILLESRFNKLETDKRKGLTVDGLYDAEFNRIKTALIDKTRE